MPSSPDKLVIRAHIDRCRKTLERMEVCLTERRAAALAALHAEMDLRDDMREVRAALADHTEALHEITAAERAERRGRRLVAS